MGLLSKLISSDAVDVTGAASGPKESVDNIISEVEVYLSYGLHNQAKEKLDEALKAFPENSKLQDLLSKTQ